MALFTALAEAESVQLSTDADPEAWRFSAAPVGVVDRANAVTMEVEYVTSELTPVTKVLEDEQKSQHLYSSACRNAQ